MAFHSVYLKTHKEASVLRRHPWIFSGAIHKIVTDSDMQEGDMVEVFSHAGAYLASGHFHSGSIAVRIFSFEQTPADENFWLGKLQKAYSLRKQLGLTGSTHINAYRLVHAEGDGLPGLIIDIYHRTAVIQCHSAGMYRQQQTICNCLKNLYGNALQAVYSKSTETLHNSVPGATNGYLWGNTENTTIRENDILFYADWEKGQKTGFFLDQRENRKLLMQYANGKKVLNTFCYSGGFSLYALKGGASEVHSVDSSAAAIALAEKNTHLNNFTNHTCFISDTLSFLKDCPAYDVMVLDPPAYAKSQQRKHNAVQGYKRLNRAGIEKVQAGGLLFTFSCSQVISPQLFLHTVTAAALESGRSIRLLHRLSQPADHPVSIFHPEGEYLKGLVLQVD